MKKKMWGCLLILALVVSFTYTGSCAAANQNFPDVGTHWAKDYIEQLTSQGYMAGYPDGTFKPDRIMTRAEFTSVLISGLGYTASDKTSRNFSDTSGSWAIASINEAVNQGILIPSEYPQGLVPDGGIKRSEACAMLIRALGQPAGTGELPFKDTAQLQSSMYIGYIKTASDLGIMNGFPNGNFEPFSEMPRAQACTVLYNLLAQQGKVPATPPSTTSTTTATTGSITYLSIDSESYNINTTPISFIVNFQEIPVKTIAATATSINVNNSYSFDLDSRNDNPDIVIYNNRYGIDKLTVSGDKLAVKTDSRKIYKFEVDDNIYNSDYVKLYVNSTNQDYYLSDLSIIDEYTVEIDGQSYELDTDKITIAVDSPTNSNGEPDFYDIIKISLTSEDTSIKLTTSDAVIKKGLSIADLAAVFVESNLVNLDRIEQIAFIMGGKKCSLGDVTIDGSGNFSQEGNIYPYTKVMMVMDDMQYKIDNIVMKHSKFFIYCGEGIEQEWAIVNDEYRDANDIRIVKGTSVYTLDEALVVGKNQIRIKGKIYKLDSDFKCQVDKKLYEIDKIYWDTKEAITIIKTGKRADTSLAIQPDFVFYNDNDEYQEGTKGASIYANRKWIDFDEIFISDPAHFTYDGKTYTLIDSRVEIDADQFIIVDTVWYGSAQIMEIYLEEN